LEIKLYKKPKNPIIIEGFPGFGLVGTIATEFLMDHLKTEVIGKVKFDEMPPMIAIHESKLIQPLGIFYNEEYNLIIFHAVTASSGFEWQLADVIVKLAKEVNAKEIISLEGVGSPSETEAPKAFYFTTDSKQEHKLKNIGLEPLKEGIIMGVTGALLLRAENSPISCFFADTHSNLPDSMAAAKVIEMLDKYLGLKIDPKPLKEQAAKFEEKLKGILQQGQKAAELSEAKKMSYVG